MKIEEIIGEKVVEILRVLVGYICNYMWIKGKLLEIFLFINYNDVFRKSKM